MRYPWIGSDQFEGVFHLRGRCTAADVEKVRRISAVQFNDIHRGHGETCTVDETSDLAIETDVVQIGFFRFDVTPILLRVVLLIERRLLPVLGIGVHVDLAIHA